MRTVATSPLAIKIFFKLFFHIGNLLLCKFNNRCNGGKLISFTHRNISLLLIGRKQALKCNIDFVYSIVFFCNACDISCCKINFIFSHLSPFRKFRSTSPSGSINAFTFDVFLYLLIVEKKFLYEQFR